MVTDSHGFLLDYLEQLPNNVFVSSGHQVRGNNLLLKGFISNPWVWAFRRKQRIENDANPSNLELCK